MGAVTVCLSRATGDWRTVARRPATRQGRTVARRPATRQGRTMPSQTSAGALQGCKGGGGTQLALGRRLPPDRLV
eukprot:4192998-Alexandrium_andersonii.AAC.1